MERLVGLSANFHNRTFITLGDHFFPTVNIIAAVTLQHMDLIIRRVGGVLRAG
ncbi:MAG: hypothetical protein U0526_01950 [Candidatus Saccharibacteria bacterium]